MDVDTYWEHLREIGWLDYVPEEQRDDVRNTLARNLAERPLDAQVALAHAAFEDDPPDDILKELAAVSQGRFVPTEIVVKHGGQSTLFEFVHGGRRYKGKIPAAAEWSGSRVMEKANQALADSEVAERFIELPGGSDFILVVCIPPPIYAKAQAAGLIPSVCRIEIAAVERTEVAKVAAMKRIPARLNPIGMYPTTIPLLTALLRMMRDSPHLNLHLDRMDSSAGITVLEVPDAMAEELTQLPAREIDLVAGKWTALAGLPNESFIIAEKLYLIREMAQQARASGQTLLAFCRQL